MRYPAFLTSSVSRSWPKILVLVAALGITSVAHAALTWAAQKIELEATTEDQETVTVFTFKNTGDAAVTVLGVTTDCGCTRAEIAKKTYATGEEGEIKTIFTIGVRVGPEEKHLLVTTSEVPTTPTDLQLIVNIKKLVLASA